MMSQKETDPVEAVTEASETLTEKESQIPAPVPEEMESQAVEPMEALSEPVEAAPQLDPVVEVGQPNEEPTSTTVQTSQAPSNEASKKSRRRRLVGLVILIILALLLLTQCNKPPMTDNDPSGPVIGDGSANNGGLDMKGYDEIKAGLQSQVDASYMNFKINLHPVFSSPTGTGNLMIENTASNPYSMVVNIFLCDEVGNPTDLVYASPILTPDQSISEDKLTESLDAGTYQALAMFMVLEEDNETLKSQSGMRIQLTVEP